MATLGSQAVGSIVKLKVNGTARNFIVVNQGLPGSMYDTSCDGTWLLMEDIYEQRGWEEISSNAQIEYAESSMHSYLNSTFVNLFDSNIKNIIKQAKIPYTKGRSSSAPVATGSNGLPAKVFLLSYTEVGFSADIANVEGVVLSYFNGADNSKRIGKKEDGSAWFWWLRSYDNKYKHYASCVGLDGSYKASSNPSVYGVRPALILPSELSVESDGTVTMASGAITGSVNIGGVQRELTGAGYINIGGVLRDLSDSQVNIGGILKSLKG